MVVPHLRIINNLLIINLIGIPSTSKAPRKRCEPICDPFEPLLNGFRNCTGNKIDDKCDQKCNSNYHLIGKSVTRCRNDSNSWNGASWLG